MAFFKHKKISKDKCFKIKKICKCDSKTKVKLIRPASARVRRKRTDRQEVVSNFSLLFELTKGEGTHGFCRSC